MTTLDPLTTPPPMLGTHDPGTEPLPASPELADPPLEPKPILISYNMFGSSPLNPMIQPSVISPGGPADGGPRSTIPTDAPRPSSPDEVAPPPTTTPAPRGNGITPWNVMQGRDPDFLRAGETVRIDADTTHVVKPGETLSSIAADYGVSVNSLVKVNGMDAALLGKDPATGLHFAVGGGGGGSGSVPTATGNVVTPTGNTNGTPDAGGDPSPAPPADTADVQIALKWLMLHADSVGYNTRDGDELQGLVSKINNNQTLSPEEQKRYEELAAQARSAFSNRPQLPTTPPGVVTA